MEFDNDPTLQEWTREQPLSVLALDSADRAVLRIAAQNSLRGSQSGGGGGKCRQSKSAMKVRIDSIRSETPRRKSPHMNNEEPIELAHFVLEKPKIERDDFPAPPYSYRRKRWSDSYKGVPVSDDEDHVDGEIRTPQEIEDEQLKREEQKLSKITTGIGKFFLKNVKEREKIKQWKAANLDSRNASR